MKTQFLLLSLCLISVCIQAQQPGTADTSFRIRSNYGFNQIPQFAAMGQDGSQYFYSPTALFSGKRSGSLFKILPNGERDSSFVSPDFHFYYFQAFTTFTIPALEVRLFPLADGSVFCFSNYRISIGDSTYETPVRFRSDGSIDLNSPILNMAGPWRNSFQTQAGALSGKNFFGFEPIPGGIRMRRFNRHGVWDSTFHFQDSVQIESHWIENTRGDVVFRMKRKGDSLSHFRKYTPGASSLSPPFGSVQTQGTNPSSPELLGVSNAGEIWERLPVPGDQTGLRLIRKRKPNGDLDPDFQAFLAPPFEALRIDSLGNLSLVWRKGADSVFVKRYTPTGMVRDSTLQISRFLFVQQDTLVLAGLLENKRWTSLRKGFHQEVFRKRQTRFGFNAPTDRLLAAEEGKLWVAGRFSEYDEHQSPGLIRLLPNGMPDTGFACQAFPAGLYSPIVYLDRFPNGDILLVSAEKEGPQQRYLHRIRPDGTADPDFGTLPALVLPFNRFTLTAAKRETDGTLWLGLVGQVGIYSRGYLVRLLPTVAADPAFSPIVIPSQQSDEGTIREIHRLNGNRLLLDVAIRRLRAEGWDPYVAAGVVKLDAPQGPVYQEVKRLTDYHQNGEFLALSDRFLLSGSPQCTRYHLNGAVDSTFRPVDWNNQALADKIHPREVLQGGDILGSVSTIFPWSGPPLFNGYYDFHETQKLVKTNASGVLDTAFVSTFFYGKIAGVLETDTLGFYLAGDVVQFGNQSVNYLVRVHNRPGQIQVSRKSTLSGSSVRQYPNPTKDLLWVTGAPADASLTFYNAQGRILFTGSGNSPISTQSWPAGVYFWRMEQQGKWVESGRVVKN